MFYINEFEHNNMSIEQLYEILDELQNTHININDFLKGNTEYYMIVDTRNKELIINIYDVLYQTNDSLYFIDSLEPEYKVDYLHYSYAENNTLDNVFRMIAQQIITLDYDNESKIKGILASKNKQKLELLVDFLNDIANKNSIYEIVKYTS